MLGQTVRDVAVELTKALGGVMPAAISAAGAGTVAASTLSILYLCGVTAQLVSMRKSQCPHELPDDIQWKCHLSPPVGPKIGSSGDSVSAHAPISFFDFTNPADARPESQPKLARPDGLAAARSRHLSVSLGVHRDWTFAIGEVSAGALPVRPRLIRFATGGRALMNDACLQEWATRILVKYLEGELPGVHPRLGELRYS